MPDYHWKCHSCKATNPAGLEICTACGFNSVATGAEIDEAITGNPYLPLPSRKELMKEGQADMAALPSWKKPIAYLLRGVQFVGNLVCVFGIFDLSGTQVLGGFGVALVAEVVFQLLKGGTPERRLIA